MLLVAGVVVALFVVGAAVVSRQRRPGPRTQPSPVKPVVEEVEDPPPFTSLDEVFRFLEQDASVQKCVFGSRGRSVMWFVVRGGQLDLVLGLCGDDLAPIEPGCLTRALGKRMRPGLIPENRKFMVTVADRRLSASWPPVGGWLTACPNKPTKVMSGSPPGVP